MSEKIYDNFVEAAVATMATMDLKKDGEVRTFFVTEHSLLCEYKLTVEDYGGKITYLHLQVTQVSHFIVD